VFLCRGLVAKSIPLDPKVSKPMSKSKVTKLERPVDKHLIAVLEETLAWAKDGRCTGAVLLMNLTGNQYTNVAAGDMQFSEVMLCWEAFKFEQLYMAAQEKAQ
jgi:hypothetical protein